MSFRTKSIGGKFLARANNSAAVRTFGLMTDLQRKKFVFLSTMQASLSILDLLGVAAIGALGALAIRGSQNLPAGNRVQSVLKSLKIENFNFETQVLLFGVLACVLLTLKTLLSIYFTRVSLRFLSTVSAQISSKLFKKYLDQPISHINQSGIQDLIYRVTGGVDVITIRILGTIVNLVADFTLTIILVFGLFLVDPLITFSMLAVLSFIAYALYLLMHLRISRLASESAQISIFINQNIEDAIENFREIFVRNGQLLSAELFESLRKKRGNLVASSTFFPSITKHIFESLVVVGSLLLGISQLMANDANRAVGNLAIFLAAGTRIAPAVMRLQQGAVALKASLGEGRPTLDLIDKLRPSEVPNFTKNFFDLEHLGFEARVRVENLSFTHPGSRKKLFDNLNLDIEPFTTVAIVGPSGAGKSSLADLIIGVQRPDSGSVSVSGISPQEVARIYPGSVGYVPQVIKLKNGTIAENISVGFSNQDTNKNQILNSLSLAQLSEFIDTLPNGIDSRIGFQGSKFSGGQRQRMGIARALYSNPKLLILDEATSSLDAITEESVTRAISSVKGKLTLIIIAHRLTTIREADTVIYLRAGRVIASGKFDEVAAKVPDFAREANLLGLTTDENK